MSGANISSANRTEPRSENAAVEQVRMRDERDSVHCRAAVELVKRGIPVFPVRLSRPDQTGKRQKTPLSNHGHLNATTDLTTIRQWWRSWPEAVPGVPTGKTSGIDALDVDPDGQDWAVAHSGLLMASGRVHNTERGKHYLFKHAQGIRNTAGKIAAGIDVRGEGGWIVWWPALGREAFGDLEDIEDMPAALAELARGAQRSNLRDGIQSGADHGLVIPEGQRNTTLTSEAGRLRRHGYEPAEIEASLNAINRNRCRPPLEVSEVSKIARSLARYESKYPLTSEDVELTDAGNGERFVQQHGDDVRFVAEWGWIVWNGKYWHANPLAARQRALETARGIHAEAAAKTDKGEQRAVTDWARKSQQAQRLQAMLWCAEPALQAKTEDFDREIMLLPVANGTVDLRSGDLHSHHREHMTTRLAPVSFSPDATCPTWQKFLERVVPDKELREFLQRLVGYSLTGSTEEQVLAFLHGKGRNGKSVFLETIAALLGAYHTATRIETLSVSRRGGIPNDVAALAGARLVSVSETPEGSRLNESLIKDLTGGDTITARFLRREFFQFQPQFKLWIRGNHKPQIRGTDDGIWRRLLLLPFAVQIPVDEVDHALPARLRAELPGILAWAIRGCLAWQEGGLRAPQTVCRAVQAYRGEMDMLGCFLDECCATGSGAMATARDLHTSFKVWCEANGEQVMSQRRFGEMLTERGFQRRKGGRHNTYRWYGIRLLASGPSDLSDLSRSSH